MSPIIIGLANILHCKLAASANSLHRPFSELQYLRKNFIFYYIFLTNVTQNLMTRSQDRCRSGLEHHDNSQTVSRNARRSNRVTNKHTA